MTDLFTITPALERDARHLHALGPRLTLELLMELRRDFAIPDLEERLARYASASPVALVAFGGDAFPFNGPWRITG